MQNQPHLQDYLQIIMRRRWIIITVFIVVFVVGLIGTLKQIPIYAATTTLLIEQKSPKVISVQEVTPMGPGDYHAYKEYYETQYKLIKGHLLLKRVAEILNLKQSNTIKESSPVEEFLVSINSTILKNFLGKASGFLGLKNSDTPAKINFVKRLYDAIKVLPVSKSQLVEIRAEDPDPVMSAKIANTVADVYIRQNLEGNTSAANNAVEWLSKKIYEQREKLREAELALSKYRKQHNIKILPWTTGGTANEDVRADYVRLHALLENYSQRYTNSHPKIIELKAQIKSLRNKIHGLEDINDGYKTMEYMALEREVQTNKRMYETLMVRQKEIDLSSTLNVNNISVINKAEVSSAPVKPNLPMNMMLSIVIGLVMGVGLGFFVDYLDTTIKSPQDVRDILESNFMGGIPEIMDKNEQKKNKVVNLQSRSPAAEAYRDVRTEILYLIPKDTSSALVVTSAEPKAGKTMTCTNLAIAFSQKGSRVLVVDADMRKPQLHNIFVFERSSGLSDYLLRNASLDSIAKDTGIENLHVVTAGKSPNNPAEIISSVRMKQFIRDAKEQYDLVLFDTPPVASVTDAVALAEMVDGSVHVVRSGKAHVPITLRVKEKLANTKTNVLGVVLNDLRIHHSDYYSYKYYRYYSEDVSE